MKKIILLMLLFISSVFGENNAETDVLKPRKTIAGISPLLIITTSGEDNEDVPVIGSFYYGSSKGRKEVLYGMGINSLTGFEFNLQNRIYSRKNATGFFGGTLLTAGVYSLKTYVNPENDKVYVSSYEGINYYAWGFRFGGNIGYRFTMSDVFYITAKCGLAYPLYKITGDFNYTEEQKKELNRINTIYKMIDLGIHLEYVF